MGLVDIGGVIVSLETYQKITILLFLIYPKLSVSLVYLSDLQSVAANPSREFSRNESKLAVVFLVDYE